MSEIFQFYDELWFSMSVFLFKVLESIMGVFKFTCLSWLLDWIGWGLDWIKNCLNWLVKLW
jgi:hypothetical protein